MNLTRHNFFQQRSFIQNKIKEAAFVAVDFEFSGVLASPLLRNSMLDSAQLRYWKLKENVKRFLPLQLGLCTFTKMQDHYVAYPFNFYIFPFGTDGYLDKQFQLSSSTISFLIDNNLDFNKTFGEGIYYISHQDEKVLKESQHLNDLKKMMRYNDRTVSFEMKTFAEQHIAEIKDFLQSTEQELQINIKFCKAKVVNYLIEQLKKEITTIDYHIKFDSDIFFKRSLLSVLKGKGEEIEVPLLDASDFGGVRILLDQISQQGTPLICHNGLLDLFYIYDKFYYNLPEKQSEFKTQFNTLFPKIYDTKYIINQNYTLFSQVNYLSELKNSFLKLQEIQQQQQQEQEQQFIVFGEECQAYNNQTEAQTFEHEAGFDAYMTGSVFANIMRNMSNLELFENKLPQGSIKVPFNLKNEADIFHGENTKLFHLEIIEKQLISEQIIKNYFMKEYNTPVDLYLSYGQNFEYFLIFQTLEAADLFQKGLNNGAMIINIDGHQFVVNEYESYVEKLQRRAKDELSISQMPSILEK